MVSMDNLSAQEVAGIRQNIKEAAEAHPRYLPAYSPDPLEIDFAKLNALLRSAAAHTVEDLLAAIRKPLTKFELDACRNGGKLAEPEAQRRRLG